MSTTRREFLNETSKIVAGGGLAAIAPILRGSCLTNHLK